MTRSFLHTLMNPKSIATAGAGNNVMKMGTMHLLSILKDGYSGKVYPIHPNDEIVLGQKAYKSPLDLPEAPELVLFILPSNQLLPVFEDFGKRGTKYAIVITAGFRETGSEGRVLEKKLVDIADKYGMRFIGPNCMGIINTEISLNTTVVPLQSPPGLLGFASQSGTYVTQSLPYLAKKGIRFSKAISVGNQANVNIIDALEYLGEDEQTRAISLYIEALSDVDRFLETARRITQLKPVLAQYIGGSEAGARSGLSHTGAMAGPDHLYDGLFRQAGIIRVHSIEDLYGFGWALATQPPLRGNRIGIVTNSGGPGSAVANTCETAGFSIPAFSENLQEQIKPLMPAHAPAGNPVDLTFAMDINILAHTIPELVMKSGEVDGVVLHGAMSSGFMKVLSKNLKTVLGDKPVNDVVKLSESRDLSENMQLPFKYGIPLIVSSFFDRDDHYTDCFMENNIPVYEAPERAALAMGMLLKYKKIRERKTGNGTTAGNPSSEALEIIRKAVSQNRVALDEYEAKRLLTSYGIPVSREFLAAGEKELAEIGGKLSFPVAVKVCHHEIMHKTERGLVHLGIKDSTGMIEAFRKIRAEAGEDVPVLVSEMVPGKREFLAGILREKNFGTWTAFGVGGIFTEALKDAVYRLSPLSVEEAREMIGDIRLSSLLGDFRKMGPVNIDSLAAVLQRLSMIPLIHPEIREIDINPLIICGSEPVVVDSLIVLGN